jgi:hypothetical protein
LATALGGVEQGGAGWSSQALPIGRNSNIPATAAAACLPACCPPARRRLRLLPPPPSAAPHISLGGAEEDPAGSSRQAGFQSLKKIPPYRFTWL